MITKEVSRCSSTLTVFPSELGWMAMIGCGLRLKCLAFGYEGAGKAVAALPGDLAQSSRSGQWNRTLVRRLQAFAAGEPVDFEAVLVDLDGLTAFRRRVLEMCRRIPYGTTLTYGQLATRAGSPGAARAVGACMAANRIPLVIPCHRVVAGDGGLGGFSSPGGTSMKRRLLKMEALAGACKPQLD